MRVQVLLGISPFIYFFFSDKKMRACVKLLEKKKKNMKKNYLSNITINNSRRHFILWHTKGICTFLFTISVTFTVTCAKEILIKCQVAVSLLFKDVYKAGRLKKTNPQWGKYNNHKWKKIYLKVYIWNNGMLPFLAVGIKMI